MFLIGRRYTKFQVVLRYTMEIQKLFILLIFSQQLQDYDGIAGVGEIIRPGDIYINKESPINTKDNLAPGAVLPDRFV